MDRPKSGIQAVLSRKMAGIRQPAQTKLADDNADTVETQDPVHDDAGRRGVGLDMFDAARTNIPGQPPTRSPLSALRAAQQTLGQQMQQISQMVQQSAQQMAQQIQALQEQLAQVAQGQQAHTKEVQGLHQRMDGVSSKVHETHQQALDTASAAAEDATSAQQDAQKQIRDMGSQTLEAHQEAQKAQMSAHSATTDAKKTQLDQKTQAAEQQAAQAEQEAEMQAEAAKQQAVQPTLPPETSSVLPPEPQQSVDPTAPQQEGGPDQPIASANMATQPESLQNEMPAEEEAQSELTPELLAQLGIDPAVLHNLSPEVLALFSLPPEVRAMLQGQPQEEIGADLSAPKFAADIPADGVPPEGQMKPDATAPQPVDELDESVADASQQAPLQAPLQGGPRMQPTQADYAKEPIPFLSGVVLPPALRFAEPQRDELSQMEPRQNDPWTSSSVPPSYAPEALLIQTETGMTRTASVKPVHPLEIVAHLSENHPGWIDWEPETVQQTLEEEFGHKLADDHLNVVFASQTLMGRSAAFWSDSHAFEKISLGLNGVTPNFAGEDHASPGELAHAVRIACVIAPGEPSAEVKTYVALCLHGDPGDTQGSAPGLLLAPEQLKFAQDELDRMSDGGKTAAEVRARLSKFHKVSLEDAGLEPADLVDSQVAYLMAIREYLDNAEEA